MSQSSGRTQTFHHLNPSPYYLPTTVTMQTPFLEPVLFSTTTTYLPLWWRSAFIRPSDIVLNVFLNMMCLSAFSSSSSLYHTMDGEGLPV